MVADDLDAADAKSRHSANGRCRRPTVSSPSVCYWRLQPFMSSISDERRFRAQIQIVRFQTKPLAALEMAKHCSN